MKNHVYTIRKLFSRMLGIGVLGLGMSAGMARAQTTLISPTGDGGFENGTTLAANGWTVVSSAGVNKWEVGTAVTPTAGTNTAYISNNNGTANAYTNTVSHTVYFYRDVTFPAGESIIQLSFKWRASGEASYDYLSVVTMPTTSTPVANSPAGGFQSWTGIPTVYAGAVVRSNPASLNGTGTFTTQSLFLPASFAGTTQRLVFMWSNDGSGGAQPPAAVDEISLTSRAVQTITSAATGNWNAASTWTGGLVPSPFDSIVINTGHTVTLDANGISVDALNVLGTLNFGATPSSLTVTRLLNVESGGVVNVFEGTTGKTLNVAGDIINNGNIDISVGTTTAGVLNLNGTTLQTISGSGSFGGANVIRNLTINNTNPALPNINWLVNNIKIAYNLTLTNARVNLGGNKLTFGAGAMPNTMTVSSGSGIMPGGKYSLYWSATALGSTISAGTYPTTTTSRYPFISATGSDRSIFISRTNATGAAAGELAVIYNDANSHTSALNLADGAYTVNTRYDGNWVVSNEGTGIASSSYTVAAFGGNIYRTQSGVSRLVNATAVLTGTHMNGTAATGAFRSAVPQAALLGSPIYIGAATSDVLNSTNLVTGAWENATTWLKGSVPSCTDSVIVLGGANVTVNATSANVRHLVIQAGGILTVSGNVLTVGCTNNNALFANSGTLNVNGTGSLVVNGRMAHLGSATFNQSGGTIRVDGNAGGNPANSVASGSAIMDILTSNVTLTGGSITLVDPHANATATETFRYNSGSNVNASVNHMFYFGDSLSTDTGGNATNGFRINTFVGSGRFAFGNLHVNLGSAPRRYLTSVYSFGVLGNFNMGMSSQTRFDVGLYVGGNIIVNPGSTLSSSSVVYLANYLNGAETASPNAQTIGGGGTFTNATTSPTANLGTLVINNNNAAGVTLNTPISLSSALTLTAGILNTGSTNLITLNAGATSSTGSATAYVNGPIRRIFAASRTATGTYSTATVMPTGKGGAYLPSWIDPSTGAGGTVTFTAEAFTTNTGAMGAGVTGLSAQRWEVLPTAGSANLTSANVQLGSTAILTSSKILQSTSATGTYEAITPAILYAAGTPNTIRTTGTQISSAAYNGYFAFGDLTPCSAPVDQATSFAASKVGSTSVVVSFSPAASSPTGYLVVRYAAGATPTTPVNATTYAAGNALGTGTVVAFGAATTINLTGLTANTAYDFYVYAYNNSACFGPTYNTVAPLTGNFTTCATGVNTPTIAAPSALNATSFVARWGSVAGASYLLDVSTDINFTTFVSGYQELPVTLDSAQVSGLSNSTVYYYRVRAVNGTCFSQLSGTTTVNTPCLPSATLPWTENFDALTTLGATNFPSCWAKINGDWATSDATQYNTARSGANYLRNSWAATNEYMVSPAFTLTGGTSYDFSFWAQGDGFNGWTVDIFYLTSIDSTRKTAMLPSYVAPGVGSASMQSYVEVKRSFIPPTTGTYYLALRVNQPSGAPWFIAFDDFRLDASPTCQTPSALSETIRTATRAVIKWAPLTILPTAGYDYYLSTTNTPPTGATTPTGNVLPDSLILTQLTPSTKYFVWVRSNCGSGTFSPWSGVDSFTTRCSSPALPWTEGFESLATGTNIFPSCWEYTNTLSDWDINATNPYAGTRALRRTWSTNGWAFTPGFALTANTTYAYSYFVRTATATVGYNITNAVGTQPAVSTMSTTLSTVTGYQGTTWTKVTLLFTPTTTDTFYFGLGVNALSPPSGIFFDNFAVQVVTPAVVSTSSANNVLLTTATLGGNIIDNGGAIVTRAGVVFSTSPSPTIGTPGVVDSTLSPLVQSGVFNINLTGLTSGVTYYYRAYTITAAGTSYGADSSFTTQSSILPPSVTTVGKSGIIGTLATFSGTINNNGGSAVTASGIALSSAGIPVLGNGSTTDITTTPLVLSGNYSLSTSGLTLGTKYYFRAYATNSAGVGYGNLDSFTTGTPISTLPYTENFELGNGGWNTLATSGANNWVLGTPAKTFLNGANSGVNAWVTKLTGNYDNNHNAAIVSPIFDFSNLTADPVLRFYHKFVTEAGYDAMVVEVSFNGGLNWQRVDSTLGIGGNFNTNNSYAWYNNNSTNGPITPRKFSSNTTGTGSGSIYSSANNGWIQSATRIVGAAGQSSVLVRFRFGSDVSSVQEGWAIDDIEMVNVTTPTIAASNVNVTSGNTSANVTFSPGNGESRIVVARLSTTIAVAPANNVSYNPSTLFGVGDITGTGNHVVYSGTGTTVSVTGLNPLTSYNFDVYEFNGKYIHLSYSVSATGVTTTTPVTLLTFSANKSGDDAMLNWATATEKNNQGFDVERSFDGKQFTKIAFVKGAVNSNTKQVYSFPDAGVFTQNSGTVYYRLKQIDLGGKYTYSNIVRVEEESTTSTKAVVYPNPFEASVTIELDAKAASNVNIEIFDLAGKLMMSMNRDVNQGSNLVFINEVADLKNGVYFMRIKNGETNQLVKLLKN